MRLEGDLVGVKAMRVRNVILEEEPEAPELDLTVDRVPSWKAKAIWVLIQRAVGENTPRWMIIRKVAQQVRLDPTSVHRYLSGRLATAPTKLVAHLQLMLEEIQAGTPVGVSHPRDPGQRLVSRAHAVAAIDALMKAGLAESKAELLLRIGAAAGVKPRRMAYVCYDPRCRFCPEAVVTVAREMLTRANYDPERIYRPGERLIHPAFGAGVVLDRPDHRHIRVRFASGEEIELCHGLQPDTYPLQRTDVDWNERFTFQRSRSH
jgi:hypothetical protein